MNVLLGEMLQVADEPAMPAEPTPVLKQSSLFPLASGGLSMSTPSEISSSGCGVIVGVRVPVGDAVPVLGG